MGRAGTGAVWTEMKTLARSGGDVFGKLRPLLDVPQYIDFMTMWMFGKSEDEYRVTGPRGPGHGAKFVPVADPHLTRPTQREDKESGDCGLEQ